MIKFKKVGILGGGQLAQMLIQAAINYGVDVSIYASDSNQPALKYTSNYMVADYNDRQALELFASKVDKIIFEFENINFDNLQNIPKDKFITSLELLAISQNRISEKNFAKSQGINVCDYYGVDNKDDINLSGLPLILKTCSFGYDGKGQYKINKCEDLDDVVLDGQYICEEYIKFDMELSVICMRDYNGEIICYEPFYNVHKNGILDVTNTKCTSLNPKLKQKVIDDTKAILVDNDFYGILCVEYFVVGDKVIFNELAPRNHNSGHITIECYNSSQFDNLMRIAIGLPLIVPKLLCDGTMTNILGQDSFSAGEDILHLYGKNSYAENRKIGHIIKRS